MILIFRFWFLSGGGVIRSMCTRFWYMKRIILNIVVVITADGQLRGERVHMKYLSEIPRIDYDKIYEFLRSFAFFPM